MDLNLVLKFLSYKFNQCIQGKIDIMKTIGETFTLTILPVPCCDFFLLTGSTLFCNVARISFFFFFFFFLDIFFIYIFKCYLLSWFPLPTPPPPPCSPTHSLLLPDPGIPLYWGIEPSQDQGPLLPVMTD
jgi:hypothetical protein